MSDSCTSELEEWKCVQNNTQTLKIANAIYSGLSFISFIISLPTLLLTMFQCCWKNISIERKELVFILSSAVLTLFTLVESFQWILWFNNTDEPGTVACKVLGVFRQYCGVMLFALIGCVGFHLGVLKTTPKWLMVIDEVKERRYRQLVIFYSLITFLVPLLTLPFPFILFQKNHYGTSEYVCWISLYSESCTQKYLIEGLIEQGVFFYIWALIIVGILTLVVVFVTVTVYCRSSRQCTTNHCTVLIVTALILSAVGIIEILFVLDVVDGLLQVPYQAAKTYAKAIGFPFFSMFINSTLLARTCYIRYTRRQRVVPVTAYVNKIKSDASCPHEATLLLSTTTPNGTF